MDEGQSTTGLQGSEPQPPITESVTPLCKVHGKFEPCQLCERTRKSEMARQEFIEKVTEPKSFLDLFDNALLGIRSFCGILDMNEDRESDRIFNVLIPLVERLDQDLKKIATVINATMGDLTILACIDFVRIDDKNYSKGEFYEAVLEPKGEPLSGELH